MSLFNNISFQHKNIQETEQILRDLKKTLSSRNQIKIFPNLKQA